MTQATRITVLAHDEWIALRDQLAANGWTLTKGGGLDHAWAALSLGKLVIEMEWDNWMEGEINYAQEQAELIEAFLPENIRALRKTP